MPAATATQTGAGRRAGPRTQFEAQLGTWPNAHPHTRTAVLLVALCGFLTLVLASPVTAGAHVPLLRPGGQSLSSATPVDDPSKSWVLYDRLGTGFDARYFFLDLKKGEKLWVQVFTPGRDAFAPSLAVMGPGITPSGEPPAALERPAGSKVAVADGVRGEAEYEPFTPGAYFFAASYSGTAPTGDTYHVAIFGDQGGGPFALAVGLREEFSVWEWLSMPIRLLAVYRWEGKGWLLLFGPALVVVLAGGGVLARAARRRRTWGNTAYGAFHWFCFGAALLALASSANLLARLVQSALVTGIETSMALTVLFAVISAALGVLLAKAAGKYGAAPPWTLRAGLVGFAGACFLLFAGFMVGPVLALAAAFTPAGRSPAEQSGMTEHKSRVLPDSQGTR